MAKKIKWQETSRRGKAHPLLVIDSLIDLFQNGYWAKAHQVKWEPKNYRQFDDARWYGEEDANKYKALLEKTANSNKVDLLSLAREYDKRIKAHLNFGKKYKGYDFGKATNEQLAEIFAKWFELTKRFWCFAYEYIFINKFLPDIITSIVASKVSDIWEQNKILGVFFEVDQPSDMRQEKKNLVEIAKLIREKKLTDKKLEERIDKHLARFAHLGFYYFRGSAYNKKDIKNRLKEYLSLPNEEFKKMLDDFNWQDRNKVLVNKYIKQLGLDKKTVKYIRYVKRWGTLSNYVDETYAYVIHHLMPLWLEISKRLEIPYHHFYSLSGQETIRALKDGKLSAKLKKEAKLRHDNHALILEYGQKKILSGNELKKYTKKEKQETVIKAGIKELKGQSASPGKARGKVRLVFTIHDVKKVERGNILVASATNPTYVPAMERAGAIVTDEGGLLSHAAIVSRELKVPCIVGTKIATRVLKDGDLIEVDANKGVVKILK